MRRFLVELQFNGKKYAGWQIQKNANTIQAEVERALEKLFCNKIKAMGCSRTDSGVSAEQYYFCFDANTKLPEERVCFKLNRFLPKDIQALSSKEVALTFDAQKDVKEKTYVYSFYCSPHILPLYSQNAMQIKDKFNIEKVQQAANILVGTHDFAAFRTIGYEENAEKKSTVKTITDIQVKQEGKNTRIYISGKGFLYNMVRIMCGVLYLVGIEEKSVQDVQEILDSKDRSKAGDTLSPKGLKLWKVRY